MNGAAVVVRTNPCVHGERSADLCSFCQDIHPPEATIQDEMNELSKRQLIITEKVSLAMLLRRIFLGKRTAREIPQGFGNGGL